MIAALDRVNSENWRGTVSQRTVSAPMFRQWLIWDKILRLDL
jgi:hypothetical protein